MRNPPILAPAVVLAAAFSLAASAQQASSTAQHTQAGVDESIDDTGSAANAGFANAPKINSEADLLHAAQSNLIAMTAVMAAGAEFCGLSTRAQAAVALPAMKQRLSASAGVERDFWTAYDAALAQARTARPDKAGADCERMRAMADPARARALEQAVKDIEAPSGNMQPPAR